MTINFTTDQGPSANNQTSSDHSHDSNQDARRPSTRDVLKAEGLDKQSVERDIDMSAANID